MELDDAVDERLVEAEDSGCSPRFLALKRQVDDLQVEVARINIILGLMGHLHRPA